MPYGSTKHIILLSVSLCILAIGLVYTILVLSSQWLQRYSSKCFKRSTRDPIIKLKPLIDAYCGPYKDKCRFWTGLLLVIRVMATVTFSYTSGTMLYLNSYLIIIMVLGLLAYMAVYGRVYRSLYNTMLETVSLLNIASLSVVNCISTYSDNPMLQRTSTIVSLTISAILFLVIILVQVKARKNCEICSRPRTVRCCRNLKQSSEDELLIIEHDAVLHSEMVREPLIYEFTIDDDM